MFLLPMNNMNLIHRFQIAADRGYEKYDKRRNIPFVRVQWDDGKSHDYDLPCNKLRLFDNGPSGMISY